MKQKELTETFMMIYGGGVVGVDRHLCGARAFDSRDLSVSGWNRLHSALCKIEIARILVM